MGVQVWAGFVDQVSRFVFVCVRVVRSGKRSAFAIRRRSPP